MSTTYEWLHTIHALAAVVWVGGAAMTSLYGIKMARAASRQERIAFTKQSQFGGIVFPIAALVVLGLGIWMVVDEPAWEFSQAWVSLGFLGVAVGAVLGSAFYGPQSRKLIAELEAGDPAADRRGRLLGTVGLAETVLLFVVVWAMITKPGL
jgi:uncharacterized membrane protein